MRAICAAFALPCMCRRRANAQFGWGRGVLASSLSPRRHDATWCACSEARYFSRSGYASRRAGQTTSRCWRASGIECRLSNSEPPAKCPNLLRARSCPSRRPGTCHRRLIEMRQPRERRDDQSAYVLHTYPYRETSVIAEALTAGYGRVALVSRGARRGRSELRGLLQAFQPLTLSWSGMGELKTLVKAEWRGGGARGGGGRCHGLAARRCCAASI